MTQHRRPQIRFTDAPRGTCRWCGEPILHERGAKAGEENRRRRWHPACVDAYNESDPREMRRRVRKRDRGLCAACGLDTKKLRREIRGRGQTARLRALGFTQRRALWEVDHVVPLIDGGTHDAQNLQTLCVPCHRAKTAAEARCRATGPGATRSETLETGALDEARTPARGDDWERLMARADRVNSRAREVLDAR